MNALSVIPASSGAAMLPAAYEAACTALADCLSLDECQGWADKAAALASYARQAEDDTLEQQAKRIQARAVRRCGELLGEFKSVGGRPRNDDGAVTVSPTSEGKETGNGAVTGFPSSQREAAANAGISLRQERTAVRVAAVPAEQFEEAVESETPPTVTKLADWGKQPSNKPDWFVDMQNRVPPPGFKAATRILGVTREFAEWAALHDPKVVAEGVDDHEIRKLRSNLAKTRRWLGAFVVELRRAS